MSANLTLDPGQSERERLKEAVASYGDAEGAFDIHMRTFMMRTFAPWISGGKALQVGCAHGDQTSLLLKSYPDLTVLEPEPQFIVLAGRKVGNAAKFVEGFVETYETNDRYDAIFFSHVLEHVIDPVVALRALGALLTPTGRLFVAVPNAEAPSRRIAVKMGVLDHLEAMSVADTAAGHRRVYRMDTLERDVRHAGLTIQKSGGIFYKPLANFQFDALIGGPLIGDAFLEGCYQLGLERPTECASLYVIATQG